MSGYYFDSMGTVTISNNDGHRITLTADDIARLIAENAALRAALEGIVRLGGNLSDANLTSKTGANDAVARGLMYTYARQTARQALSQTAVDFDEEDWRLMNEQL